MSRGLLDRRVLTFALAAIVASLACCRIVTRRDMTRAAMTGAWLAIHDYSKKHGALPASLEALPEPEGELNYRSDWWHHPLRYEIDASGVMRLFSYGSSGRPGDPDTMSESYYSRRKDGSFWVPADDWLFQARAGPGL